MANELGLMMRKNKWKMPMNVFFKDARLVFKWDKLGKEILGIAFPAALAVAADPIASLIDTIFVGHIGAIELAAVGVSVAIFNQASRITIFPLVSITTSFVAEEDTIRKTPSLKELQFGRFLRNGSLLLARVIAVTFCVTLAASMAARLGPTPMAAFQTCLQVWMTSSLLADGLAVAGQAILACAFAEKDYEKTTATATRVLQMSFVLGVGLAVVVAGIMYFGAGIFSGDAQVQALIHIGVPFVAATQPMNSLAFVFDGVNFGASDFAYSAYSLTLVAIATILSLFLLSKSYGFVGIWTALAIYMALRTLVGLLRMGSGTGPWRYLKGSLLP